MNVATSSLFSQLLSLVDRNCFAKLVRETCGERRSKGFASWDHFVAMLFCHIAQARSLRVCAVKTREGAVALLEILGDNPRSGRTRLRYKPVQPAADRSGLPK